MTRPCRTTGWPTPSAPTDAAGTGRARPVRATVPPRGRHGRRTLREDADMTGVRTPALALDVYGIGWLAGGPRRVVETAVVALVESGRLRVAQPVGELHVVSHRPRHPVEAAVLDAAGRGRRSVDGVYWRVVSDGRLATCGQQLEDAGLLAPGAGDPAGRRWSWMPARTRAGRRALRDVRRDLPAGLVAGGTTAVLVALSGPAAVPDRELRAVLVDPPRPALPPVPGSGGAPSTGVRGGGLYLGSGAGFAGHAGGYGYGGGGGLGGGFGGDCGAGGGGDGGGC
ncbi:TIGR04222 domain-containing membrane protein [Geodermatophilus sp. SYSU D00079]